MSAPDSARASSGPSTEMAVLFADIAGSTKLYDTLGDSRAKLMVDECIGVMRDIVGRYAGRIIKTIGDEVMCVLPSADNGHLAATDMQLKIAALPAVSDVKRAIRVGFHFGR
jgi:adenylate cyclase